MPDAQGNVQEAQGIVVEALPNALYRVELVDGSRLCVVAHVAAASGLLRVLPGDKVSVELTERDAGRARILRRGK